MDFDLSRIDYLITGVTYPDTLKLLPSAAPNLPQKIVIGDKDGVLQCVGVKSEEPQVVFKTLPGKEITSVQLAGAPGTLEDKIFTASGNEVKGYTRKGKVFLALSTNLSEPITAMCVSGPDLVVGSGATVTHYRDLQEAHSYACGDRVLDIAVLHTINSTKIRLVVAVANKGVLLLEQGDTLSGARLGCGAARLLAPPADRQSLLEPVVFYGAADGSIGILTFDGVEIVSRCLLPASGLGAVSCASWWALAGATYLLVGRHDGSVQLFLLDPDNYPDKPKLKYSYFCGERVTGVAGGCVGGAGEVLAATYSGRVFALRPRDRAPDSHRAVAARLAQLQAEVARLEKQVTIERDRYQRSAHAPSGAAGLSAPPTLHLEDELTGVSSDNWQELRLSSAGPLDLLLLRCPHELLVRTDGVSVLSVCPAQDDRQEYLGTVRCQAGTRRLCLRVRNPRPRARSTLTVYVVAAGAPRVARLRTYNLVPLAHYSVHEAPENLQGQDRVWSELVARGAFSAAEMSSWLARALPGDSARAAPRVTLARAHSVLPTVLLCDYTKGTATFRSDNLSTLAILKDVISKCSVERNITVDMDCTIAENCALESFKRIQDLITEEYKKVKEAYLRKAISELDLELSARPASAAAAAAAPVCADYWRLATSLPADRDHSQHQLLIDTVRDWFADGCALRMVPCRAPALAALTHALEHGQLGDAEEVLAAGG